jgi:hypothetical protein
MFMQIYLTGLKSRPGDPGHGLQVQSDPASLLHTEVGWNRALGWRSRWLKQRHTSIFPSCLPHKHLLFRLLSSLCRHSLFGFTFFTDLLLQPNPFQDELSHCPSILL